MSAPTGRAIPADYHVCQLSLVGESPLLMSSGEADRESDTFKAYRGLSKVCNKSDEEESRHRERSTPKPTPHRASA
jgi:hypothetical protein